MSISADIRWRDAVLETLRGYRNVIDKAIAQLDDEQLMLRPAADFNSPATLLRHLGGNLQSRWTEFLSSDGEKPSRNRDREFAVWVGDRQSLLDFFESGWNAIEQTLQSLEGLDFQATVQIRGEDHTVPQAVQRSLTHIAYHVGQLLLIARMNRQGEAWDWLTIEPGKSQQHNESTWGDASSRGTFGGR